MKDALAVLRAWLFRFRCRATRAGVSIGPGLRLYCRLQVLGPGRVTIGAECKVAGIPGEPHRWTTIYTHSPSAEIRIGNRARLYAARISSTHGINIGDNCLIEDAAVVDTDFHSIEPDRGDPGEISEHCRVSLGDRVAIGARSTICKGVAVGDDVLVFPGSVVTKSLPPGCIAHGNPARMMHE